MIESPREAFARCRPVCGLTLDELCYLFGTSRSMIYYVERGERTLPRHWLDLMPLSFAAVIEAAIREQFVELNALELLLQKLKNPGRRTGAKGKTHEQPAIYHPSWRKASRR